MRISFKYALVLALLILGCSYEKKGSASVAGVYLNTYTAEVADPATGNLWGKRTIRDTLFIQVQAHGFKISNKKWMHNTYDGKGWVTSMQGESESLPSYFAELDTAHYSLVPSSGNVGPLLFWEGEKIYLGEARALMYLKVD